MNYDHNKKAGNEGDVVKHVALIASLDTVIRSSKSLMFRYADIFAGYAHNPIVKGNEWKNGIGKIVPRTVEISNKHVANWYNWYLSCPQLEGGIYPGSSLIAFDVASCNQKTIQMSLWDISPPVISDLKSVYFGLDHKIYDHPAIHTQE